MIKIKAPVQNLVFTPGNEQLSEYREEIFNGLSVKDVEHTWDHELGLETKHINPSSEFLLIKM